MEKVAGCSLSATRIQGLFNLFVAAGSASGSSCPGAFLVCATPTGQDGYSPCPADQV